ncbi:MAG TPA: hypothetical protein DD673_16105, partial [Lentisphaeria bacterium]|nr:hypothetical protein [Lentisphaeria bacterium]
MFGDPFEQRFVHRQFEVRIGSRHRQRIIDFRNRERVFGTFAGNSVQRPLKSRVVEVGGSVG